MQEFKGKVIAVVNNKGGVGKSTICANLGHALSSKSNSVLVVDLDSQCNSSTLLMKTGIRQFTLYDVLDESSDIEVGKCIYPSQFKRLDILPNEEAVSALEIDLIIKEKFGLLRDRLRAHVISNYDYTLLDCPPNLLYFVISALWMSDYAVIPVAADSRFSLDGMNRMIDFIDEQKENSNVDLRFLRVVINMVDNRTTVAKMIRQGVLERLGEAGVFDTTIPANASIKHAEFEGSTVLKKAPSSKGARAFRSLASELEAIVGLNRQI